MYITIPTQIPELHTHEVAKSSSAVLATGESAGKAGFKKAGKQELSKL